MKRILGNHRDCVYELKGESKLMRLLGLDSQ